MPHIAAFGQAAFGKDVLSNYLKEKLNRVIEVFNEYDIDCDSDEDYIEQLFADYGIKYKIYKP